MQAFLRADVQMHAQREVVMKCAATTEPEKPELLSMQAKNNHNKKQNLINE